ncbi:MAG: hypothetical protein AAF587_24295 [Bacteroidota bacterium]
MPLFNETQRFQQMWIWILLLGICGVMIFGIFQEVFIDGRSSMSIPALLLTTLVPVGMVGLIRSIFMRTVISEEEIYIRFFPFITRIFPLQEIKEAYVRECAPIREFGGWGIRWAGKRGVAYNVSGRHGVQLVLHSGKKVFIGTQQPKELQRVIDQLEVR